MNPNAESSLKINVLAAQSISNRVLYDPKETGFSVVYRPGTKPFNLSGIDAGNKASNGIRIWQWGFLSDPVMSS